MEFFLLVCNSTSHSFAALTRELWSWTLEEKFHIYARQCIILYLDYTNLRHTSFAFYIRSDNMNALSQLFFFLTESFLTKSKTPTKQNQRVLYENFSIHYEK